MEHPLLIKKINSESQMMKDYSLNKSCSTYVEFETESPICFCCITLNEPKHNIYIMSDDSSEPEAVMGNSCLGICADHFFIHMDIPDFKYKLFDLKLYGLGLFYNDSTDCFYCINQTGFFSYDIKNKTESYKDVGDLILDWRWADKERNIIEYSFDSSEFYSFNFLSMS